MPGINWCCNEKKFCQHDSIKKFAAEVLRYGIVPVAMAANCNF